MMIIIIKQVSMLSIVTVKYIIINDMETEY